MCVVCFVGSLVWFWFSCWLRCWLPVRSGFLVSMLATSGVTLRGEVEGGWRRREGGRGPCCCLKGQVYVCRNFGPQAHLQDLLPARADIFLMPDTSTLTASTASSSLLPPQSTRWPPLWLACGTLWCCFPLPCMSGRNESGVWLKLNAVAVAYIALDDGCRDCDRPLPHSFSTIVRVRPGRACACPPPLCVFGSCLTMTG